MKWVVFLAVAVVAVMHVASNCKDAFRFAFVDLMYRVTRTTGTGAIIRHAAAPDRTPPTAPGPWAKTLAATI